MRIDTPALRTLAEEFAAAHPALDTRQQQTAVAVYRLLTEGRPVDAETVADRTGLPPEQVTSYLDAWPAVHRDGDRRVVGLWGLTLRPTRHAFDVGGRILHTWCAVDTLFLPELLGRTARVRSTSPTSGQTITLTVDAAGVRDITPASAAMTLRRVTAPVGDDVIDQFCCHVHFFATADEARAWTGRDDNTLVVSVFEGFEYGRHYNRRRFGALLEGEPA